MRVEPVDRLYVAAMEGAVAIAAIAAMLTPATFDETSERVSRFLNEIMGNSLDCILDGLEFGDRE